MITQEALKDIFLLDEFGRLVRKNDSNRSKAGSFSKTKDRYGYVLVSIKNKTYLAHRLVWLFVHGSWPDGDIDHINRIKDDNRPINLRIASKSQSRQNIGVQKNNKSGFKGVWLHKQTGKWCSSISINKKNKHLGSFNTKEEAHLAYVTASKVLHDFNIF